ncbi:hypothetical protein FRC09_005763, partial [Ceratobasidium sp. 395]
QRSDIGSAGLRLVIETAKRDKAELQRRSANTAPDGQGEPQPPPPTRLLLAS